MTLGQLPSLINRTNFIFTSNPEMAGQAVELAAILHD
jgi:hypothetical protein